MINNLHNNSTKHQTWEHRHSVIQHKHKPLWRCNHNWLLTLAFTSHLFRPLDLCWDIFKTEERRFLLSEGKCFYAVAPASFARSRLVENVICQWGNTTAKDFWWSFSSELVCKWRKVQSTCTKARWSPCWLVRLCQLASQGTDLDTVLLRVLE